MEPCVFSFRLIPDLFDWSFWPLGLVYRWYEVDFLLFGVWACYWLVNRLVRTWGMGLIVNTLRVPLQEVSDTSASGRPVLDLWVTTPLGNRLWTPVLWSSFFFGVCLWAFILLGRISPSRAFRICASDRSQLYSTWQQRLWSVHVQYWYYLMIFISIRVPPFGVGSMEPYDVSAIALWIHSVSGHCFSALDFIDFLVYPHCSLEHRSLLGHWLQTLVTLGIIAYGHLFIALATPMIWGDFIYSTLWCWFLFGDFYCLLMIRDRHYIHVVHNILLFG